MHLAPIEDKFNSDHSSPSETTEQGRTSTQALTQVLKLPLHTAASDTKDVPGNATASNVPSHNAFDVAART